MSRLPPRQTPGRSLRRSRRTSRSASRDSSPWLAIVVLMLGVILVGGLGYRFLAPKPPAAVPGTTVSADADLSAIAARPASRRDQTSPFAVGWRMLDPQEGDFNLPVPATTRLTESFEGPFEGVGRIRQLSFGGINADAVVTVFWNAFDGVEPSYIDNAFRTRPAVKPANDNISIEVISDQFETFLGYPARRERQLGRSDGRIMYTETITCWSDRFSLSVTLGNEGKTRQEWADRFFDAINIAGKSNGEPPAEMEPLNGEMVDLISETDIFGSDVSGDWSREGDELISRGGQALLILPVLPTPACQLTIEAKRESGRESLGVGFVAGGRQCRFGIDEFDGRRSGLALLDNQTTLQQPAGQTDFGNLLGNDWNTITLTVLPAGDEVRIIGTVNDQIIVDWTGDPARLSHSDMYWKPPPETLFLTIWEDPFRFRRIELRDLTPMFD